MGKRLWLFLGITFAWSWGIWAAMIALGGYDAHPAMRPLTSLGAFGPAVGGVVALRLTSAQPHWGVARGGFVFGAALVLVAVLANLYAFSADGLDLVHPGRPDPLPTATYASLPGIALVVMMMLVSGYVFGSIGAPDPTVAAYFRGLMPNRAALKGALLVLLILPATLLLAHGLERLLGGNPPLPYVLTASPLDWVPAMLVGLLGVAALTGGNEEHGWRGVMQPLLHRWCSPLVAALLILLVWDAWHLPLHMGGVYGAQTDLLAAFVGRLPTMLLFSIVLAAIYQASRGSIFLCVLFHACLNTQMSFFAGNSSRIYGIMVGVALIVILVLRFRLWDRRNAFRPSAR